MKHILVVAVVFLLGSQKIMAIELPSSQTQILQSQQSDYNTDKADMHSTASIICTNKNVQTPEQKSGYDAKTELYAYLSLASIVASVVVFSMSLVSTIPLWMLGAAFVLPIIGIILGGAVLLRKEKTLADKVMAFFGIGCGCLSLFSFLLFLFVVMGNMSMV